MGDNYIESATNTNPYYMCVYQAKEGSAEGWGILDFIIGQRIGFIDILMSLLLLICCYMLYLGYMFYHWESQWRRALGVKEEGCTQLVRSPSVF